MDRNGKKWIEMNRIERIEMYKMVRNEYKWIEMNRNESNRIELNGSEWIEIVRNRLKWIEMHTNG